ncbi:hypothetical protein [Halorussus marinus]|uniref:hypothetical protein n=1 Tax=Halorussus marinus TaxID=2505976 RepID=UPI00106DF3A6|nr:hypothetical protein [Halorussus marinus]
MVNLVQNVLDMISLFTDVALNTPVTALLLLVGFVFVAGSSLMLAYLVAGAVVDLLTPESLGRRPPQQG